MYPVSFQLIPSRNQWESLNTLWPVQPKRTAGLLLAGHLVGTPLAWSGRLRDIWESSRVHPPVPPQKNSKSHEPLLSFSPKRCPVARRGSLNTGRRSPVFEEHTLPCKSRSTGALGCWCLSPHSAGLGSLRGNPLQHLFNQPSIHPTSQCRVFKSKSPATCRNGNRKRMISVHFLSSQSLFFKCKV